MNLGNTQQSVRLPIGIILPRSPRVVSDVLGFLSREGRGRARGNEPITGSPRAIRVMHPDFVTGKGIKGQRIVFRIVR